MRRNRAVILLVKQSKRQARELLDTGNNRLWLILSLCLWIFTAGGGYLLGAGFVYVADRSIFTDQPSALAMVMMLLSYGLMLLLALTLLVPMSGGVMLLARRVYEKKTLGAADLFLAFDSFGQYFRCLGLGFYALAWPLLTLAVAALGCLVLPSLLYEAMLASGAINVLCVLACAGCALLGGLLALAAFCFGLASQITLVLMARGEKFGQAMAHTRAICSNCRAALLYYRVSLIGHAALAVVTVGVSAVLDTLPWLLLSHQFLCDALISRKK